LLQCLVAAVRPLRVKELAEVLAFDFIAEGIPKLNPGWRWEDEEEAIMSACSSLVMIVEDEDTPIVQFSHFSVKEFLTADRLAEPIRDVSRYHIRLEDAHTILAQACLGVLLQLDDHIDRDKIENFPLAQYAARYWPTHARIDDASLCIKDAMKCLFDADRPHFATWLWIYNEEWGRNFMATMFPAKPEASPLYYAARFGFRDLAEHLIAKNPEHISARGGGEETPMHIAASKGHANVLSLLLEHGADLDSRTSYGQTPMHRAFWFGELEAGQYLLDRGADIHAQGYDGRSSLYLAGQVENLEIARILLERGAAINTPDNGGWTPLYAAVYRGKIRVVRLLLEHGADVNARTKRGKTPSQMALESGRHEIVELLSEYGAESVK
jgi:ankyrin repeat protein